MALDLDQVNQRLRAAKCRASIVAPRSGLWLYLKATLPPKPGSKLLAAHQQRIALGVRNNPAGLRRAEAEAKKLSSQLDLKEFDWTLWLPQEVAPIEAPQTTGDLLLAFKADYFTLRPETQASQNTWRKRYWESLQRLDPSMPLTADLLCGNVARTKPGTRSRQLYVEAAVALAKFAKFSDLDIAKIKRLKGVATKTEKNLDLEVLPNEALIIEWFNKIPNQHWKWIYGVMATYGLRNHEAFRCQIDSSGVCRVSSGKTGSREVWPLPLEWVDLFDLRAGGPPPHDPGQSNSDLGHRIGTQFRRYEIPFNPYLLRHAWAVRAIHRGLDSSIAARMQGHSVQMHTNTYHKWLSRRDYELAMGKIYKGDQGSGG